MRRLRHRRIGAEQMPLVDTPSYRTLKYFSRASQPQTISPTATRHCPPNPVCARLPETRCASLHPIAAADIDHCGRRIFPDSRFSGHDETPTSLKIQYKPERA
jgi:hypothetical protein